MNRLDPNVTKKVPIYFSYAIGSSKDWKEKGISNTAVIKGVPAIEFTSSVVTSLK